MILQCKNCNARYLVPDHAIGKAGRTVRCARCAYSWFEQPNSSVDSEGSVPSDFDSMIEQINAAPKPIPEGSNLPTYRKNNVSTTLKLATIFFAILVSVLYLFITMPHLFGISSSKELVLADIKIDKQNSSGKNTVEISGNIFNTADNEKSVPNIRVMLLDGANNPLQSWEFKSDNQKLGAKQTIPFSTGTLDIKFSIAKRFVVDLGTPIELALRRKP